MPSSRPKSTGRSASAASAPAPSAASPPPPLETEWQLDAADLAAVERWLASRPDSGPVRVGPPVPQRLADLYLDTPDAKIFRAGYVLRLRRAGRRVEATLKSTTSRERGLAVRHELTQPVRAATPGAIFAAPGPVADRLQLFCRARELRPLVAIRTLRRSFPLTHTGRPAGELTLDRTQVAAPGGRSPRLLRVEVEVPARLVPRMRRFVEELRAACGLTPATESKVGWALAARGLAPRVPRVPGSTAVHAAMTVGEVAFAVLRKYYAALLWHEPGTRLGEDPEHLHDMRVATRRLRAALRLFAGVLPVAEGRRLRCELRLLGRALGAVRDLDVQIEQIGAWRGSLIAVAPEALDPLLGLLAAQRSATRAVLLELLDSARYRRLEPYLVRRLRRGPRPRRPGVSVPVRSAAPAFVRRLRRRVLRQAELLATDAPPAVFHELRIRGKRLRYALEFLEPVYGPPARALIRELVRLQDILGLHQDAQVAIVALPALCRAAGADLPAEARSAAGEIVQLYSARAAQLRGEAPEAVRCLRGKTWQDLKAAMAAGLAELAAEVLRERVAQAEAGHPARPRRTAIRRARRPGAGAGA